MIGREYSAEVLSRFARNVINESRQNLLGRNASRKLTRSLGYDLKVNPNSLSLEIEMEDYGKFQDKGVRGSDPKAKRYNTPYRYTNEMPPSKVFSQWTVRRGIAPRGEGGKFLNRKSLQFAIARNIYKYGIKPTLFFTRPFRKYFETLPDEIVEAYGLDAEDLMRFTLNTDR